MELQQVTDDNGNLFWVCASPRRSRARSKPKRKNQTRPADPARISVDIPEGPYIYLMMDSDGIVRYVGRGQGQRVYQHTDKPWHNEIAQVTIEPQPSIAHASLREASLIFEHRSTIYNIAGVTR